MGLEVKTLLPSMTPISLKDKVLALVGQLRPPMAPAKPLEPHLLLPWPHIVLWPLNFFQVGPSMYQALLRCL